MSNKLNKQSKRLDDEAQTIQQLATDAAAGGHQALQDLLEDQVVLRKVLSKLSPRQRLVLEKSLEGHTIVEIAQILQTSILSVYRIMKTIQADLFPLPVGSDVIQSLVQARERYTELIDKKFSASLSLDEQAELARLEARIDEAEAPLYDETIKLLKEIRDRLSSDPSRQSGGSD